jgi:hypothetical protein
MDRRRRVIWDTDFPRAKPIARDEPPKMKIVYGPSRTVVELDYPEEYGTNWGPERSTIPPSGFPDRSPPLYTEC